MGVKIFIKGMPKNPAFVKVEAKIYAEAFSLFFHLKNTNFATKKIIRCPKNENAKHKPIKIAVWDVGGVV